ncbi:hypothetical protein [Tropicimonas sp. IMCC34043]|uniref:hypothetical protein n=1 Tax=Tropicimonas sp. IMCC34043 TaxID=2248760 RepID=UPI0018E4DCA7|nr:hypothetical protein [Tropicimonas sp. IMCC34043]
MRSTLTALTVILAAGPGMAQDLTSKVLRNTTAYIPPQCYTDTQNAATGKVENPCFTCHVRARVPNYVNDPDLQQSYAFPGPALKNPWTNLFVDRTAAIAAVSDAEIDAYVEGDNYFDADGTITLARKLADLPADWDYDKDGAWAGYVPDAYFAFDDAGFDHAPDGTPTGWRAFAYMPLPSTFWPANGSTDDVLIRLPEIYRTTADGRPDAEAYKLNLAITEALIRRSDVAIDPVDETVYGVDLDKDGTLGTADHVAFDWAPKQGRNMSYVGAAKDAQAAGDAPLAAGLFPLGTEFLHTVRYIDVAAGDIAMAPRIKEVRYARKTSWRTYANLEDWALAEIKEDADFPDRTKQFFGNLETGIGNGTGWRYQAFIEDAQGDLRPQTFEETVFCMGCHGSIGVTDDAAFAFPRKLAADTAHARGWYHWTQKGLQGTPDPVRTDGNGEILYYLLQNGAGDEFRNNHEIIARAFDADGTLDPAFARALEADVTVALFPSAERARTLNKAYREVVLEQSFEKGRDAVASPARNVHREVEQDEPTGLTDPLRAANW